MPRTFVEALAVLLIVSPAVALEPIPDKLVVLTFDDSAKSHFTIARPLLTKYKFAATFFITEGFDFPTNKKDYMTWEEIAQLHKDGFEIGNHTRDHMPVTAKALAELPAQLRGINEQCKKHGDVLVRIPMAGKISSLNVSVAAGVVLFEWKRARQFRGQAT